MSGKSGDADRTDGAPVVDEKGRPLDGDGTTRDEAPVVAPSEKEQIPPASRPQR